MEVEKIIESVGKDGKKVLSNILNKNTGKYLEYKEVDGVTDQDVIDGKNPNLWDVYIKYKDGKYYIMSEYLDKDKLFLEKDSIVEVRAMSTSEILLLKIGYYKGVRVNGYYEKGDTPTPIEYFLSGTGEEDDGGSVLKVGNLTLQHYFSSEIHSSYFGISDIYPLLPEQNTARFQKIFDLSNVNGITKVIIGRGVHEIDSRVQELRYRVSNSELIFEDSVLKLTNGSGRLSGTQIIMFLQCSNVVIRDMKLDGNRDNVVIREDDRGKQFTFSAYEFVSDLYFIGGWCKNAAQSHLQNTSEGLIIEDMVFDTSGEHSLYLTLITDNPRKSVIIRNCRFHRWAIDFSSTAISLRDYRYGLIDNCIFEVHPNDGGVITNVTGGGAIQTTIEYDSHLEENETLIHLIKDCTIINHPDFSYSILGRKKGINGVYVKGGYLERPTAGEVISVDGVNVNIKSSYRWEGNPDTIQNCIIRCRGLWFTNSINFENNLLYSTGQETGGVVISLQSATSGTYIIKNNEFHNFIEDSNTFGLIRGNADCVLVLDGNKTFNCTNGRLARSRSVNDIVVNNKNMTPNIGSFPIRYDVTPKLFGNNNQEPIQGSDAERPRFSSSTIGGGVGHKYFDTTLGKPIWWNGTNWVDSTGTVV